MTSRTYSSPEAFKQALEQRLRTATGSGAGLARKRQLLVFDRFLARVVAVLGDAAEQLLECVDHRAGRSHHYEHRPRPTPPRGAPRAQGCPRRREWADRSCEHQQPSGVRARPHCEAG
jgi:hypothetical protein